MCLDLGKGCITVLQALKYVGIQFDFTDKPSNILITAASGRVGQCTVQLAKLGNINETVMQEARNIQLIKSLGADDVTGLQISRGKLGQYLSLICVTMGEFTQLILSRHI